MVYLSDWSPPSAIVVTPVVEVDFCLNVCGWTNVLVGRSNRLWEGDRKGC